MINSHVWGIDPGATGAACFLAGKTAYIFNFSALKGKWSDGIGENIRATIYPPVYIEEVHSMPHDGGAGAFAFGENFGILKGILIQKDIDFKLIMPQTWQKGLGLPELYVERYREEIKPGKNSEVVKKQIRKRTNLLFAQETLYKAGFDIAGKLNLQTADAVCIAIYGQLQEEKQ